MSKRYFDLVDHGEGVSRLGYNTKGSSSVRMKRFCLVSLGGRELARVEQKWYLEGSRRKFKGYLRSKIMQRQVKKSPTYGCCFQPSAPYMKKTLQKPTPNPPMPICSLISYQCHIWTTDACGSFSLSFHKGLLGEPIPLCSYSVYLQYSYMIWSQRAFESGMKENESSSLPWITYQEPKLDLTYWEGREPVSPNKARPPWHIQSLMSLCPPALAPGVPRLCPG